MNDGKLVNVTILYLNINFWKIANFEFMFVVHRERASKNKGEKENENDF